jgi:hypothetical protein
MHKKSFSVDVNDELSEKFSAQSDERGYTKYRAIEGALRAFVAMPPELQVSLMSANKKDAYTILVDGLVRAEIAAHLDRLGPAKEEFLALLRQAKAKAARKK